MDNAITIVMGVSGAGKSALAQALAAQCGARFIEGDGLHPLANRQKMAAGTALSDNDRWPWLDSLAAEIRAAPKPAVASCSALKRAYRDRLRAALGAVTFIHLHPSDAVLVARLEARQGHFMPPALLASQLSTLEPLGHDEAGLTLREDLPLAEVLAQVMARLG